MYGSSTCHCLHSPPHRWLILFKQDEWTGEQKLQYADVPEDIEPEEIRPMGNYAVSITWPDGFSQVI